MGDVKVHHKKGCDRCGRTDAHTHTQAEWKETVEEAGKRFKK